ncbi:hypothetical protein R1sor_025715 [Riccia sorocarpa]|uniref:DUF7869 domain-containing protein n=1 Tax=Riccia sorocarpa TaxID=122646 RepID=A0ABD3G9D5_9MARC
MSGRSCYYSHNQLACDEPSLYKSSIHDGMDSSKTAVPRLDNYVKALSGVGMPVPVKIAGILNRGHGPPALAHVTIGGDLVFEKELQHPLLKAFMNKDIFTKTVAAATTLLPQQASTSTNSNPADKPFNKLPPTFYMQLDNSGKDNKNWVLMAFFSELVARGVFKTVFMYFLIVGHTHEDVDAFFSKVNRALSFQHISNIPQLMAAVMEAEEKKALPRFITEVAEITRHMHFHIGSRSRGYLNQWLSNFTCKIISLCTSTRKHMEDHGRQHVETRCGKEQIQSRRPTLQ